MANKNLKYHLCLFVFCINFFFTQSSGFSQALITADFSHERGFYNQPFDLDINTNGFEVSVKYTLDGSEPTVEHGISPVNINSFTIADINRSTVVRALFYNIEDTILRTHSYIFIDDVFSQNKSSVVNFYNFQPEWGFGPISESNDPTNCISQTADYDMNIDSCITKIPNYQQKLLDGLMEIPTMAISLDKSQIFGQDSGIYIFPVEENTDCYTIPPNVQSWERKASVEIFNDVLDGDTMEYQVEAGLEISGASTRKFDFSKHSFKLRFRSEYGAKKMNYPLFGEEATKKIESLQLRMVGHSTPNDYNPDRRLETQYHKDAWARHIQKEMSGYGTSATSKFFHLFINGIYWGMYDVCERPDEHFMADYNGGEPEDYDIIKINEVKNGTDSVYKYMYQLAHSIYDTTFVTQTTYQGYTYTDDIVTIDNTKIKPMYDEIQTILDVDQFAEYILFNVYVANADWKNNNWLAARNTTQNSKFQFFVWDAELILNYADGLKNGSIILSGKTDNLLIYNPIDLHQRLLNVPEYKIKFADHIQCHCIEEDGVLNVNNAIESYKNFEQKIHNASLLEFARWGDTRKSYRDYVPFCYDVIEETTQKYEDEIFPFLLDHMLRYYGKPTDYNVFPNYIKYNYNRAIQGYEFVEIYNFKAVEYSSIETEVDNGYLLELNNFNTHLGENNEQEPVGEIYYTTDGSDPRNIDGTISSSAIRYTAPIVIDKYKLIKARVYAETYGYEEIGTKKTLENLWTAMCPKEFFPKNYYDDIVINEIHYHPAPVSSTNSGSNLEFLEVKNIGTNEVDISNTKFTEGIKYQFPLGTKISSNGYVVLVSDSLAAKNFYQIPITGQYEGKLDNGGELVVLSRPDDVEIDAVNYDDIWDVSTDGGGASLSLFLDLSDKLNNNLANSWSGSADNFTPNVENLFCAPITFNFGVYKPSCFMGSDGFISLQLTGGTGNLNINWSNGGQGNMLTNLNAGTYEAEVTDAKNCIVTESVILPNANPIISNLQVTHASSLNAADGFATVGPFDLSDNYIVEWSDGGTGNTNYNLVAENNYWVTVKNDNTANCSITENFTVEVESPCTMPFNFSSTAISENSAIIAWTGNINNTGYTVSYKPSNSANWSSVTTFLPSVMLSSLEPCTYYDYKVNANCNNITSNSSTIKTFVTSYCDDDFCEGVVNGNTINITSFSAFILWDVVPNAKYRLKYRKNGVTNWREHETSSNFSILFGLDNCSNYEWSVDIKCPSGIWTANEVNNFTTANCERKPGEIDNINDSFINDFDFTLYPNPAQNFIKISSNSPQPIIEAQVLVYDMSGKMLKNGGAFVEQTTLNIEDLAPGIYITQIVSKTKSLQYRFRKE